MRRRLSLTLAVIITLSGGARLAVASQLLPPPRTTEEGWTLVTVLSGNVDEDPDLEYRARRLRRKVFASASLTSTPPPEPGGLRRSPTKVRGANRTSFRQRPP
jgi:hypothetical protein